MTDITESSQNLIFLWLIPYFTQHNSHSSGTQLGIFLVSRSGIGTQLVYYYFPVQVLELN